MIISNNQKYVRNFNFSEILLIKDETGPGSILKTI